MQTDTLAGESMNNDPKAPSLTSASGKQQTAARKNLLQQQGNSRADEASAGVITNSQPSAAHQTLCDHRCFRTGGRADGREGHAGRLRGRLRAAGPAPPSPPRAAASAQGDPRSLRVPVSLFASKKGGAEPGFFSSATGAPFRCLCRRRSQPRTRRWGARAGRGRSESPRTPSRSRDPPARCRPRSRRICAPRC